MTAHDPELARLLSSMALWLDGVSKFIAISKGEWRNAYTGHHLLAQDLRKHTLSLKKQALTLSKRYGIPGSVEFDPAAIITGETK